MGARGQAKTGGRAKGSPNKSTLPLREMADKLGVDPFEILLRFAKGDWEGLGYSSRVNPLGDVIIQPEMRIKAASEACQYIHAKRKAIETSVDPQLIETIKALENKSDEELLAILKQKPQY